MEKAKTYLKQKNKFAYFQKVKIYDIFIFITVIYYTVKYKVLTITLSQDLNSMPGSGWPRREHLVGHRLLTEPLFMGGAYSGSIDNFNLGPIPYNYPVALGWLFNDIAPNIKISPFYITTNVFYFITLVLLIATVYISGKIYGKMGAYTFIFISIASITINHGSHYYNTIPTYMNPGSVQFYSILLIFLFLASIKLNNKKYLYLLIFFSGVLLQNYIATIFYSVILLLYGLYSFKIAPSKNKLTYFYISISLLPWIQILIRILSDLTEINKTIKFIAFRNSWESSNDYSIPLSHLINQMPFNNTLSNFFDINQIPENLSILFFLYFISSPLLSYLILKKEIKNNNKKLRILKVVSFFFILDILLNFYASNETQQFNHLAGYAYLSTFLFLLNLLYILKGKSNKVLIVSLIAVVTFSNTSFSLPTSQENRIITDSTQTELLNQPIKIVRYDYYNGMNTVYTDLVYELLANKVDLCLLKPEEDSINELYGNEIYAISTLRNKKFVSHLFCNTAQLADKERKSLYLIEDPSMSLPIRLKNATLITRITNKNNLRCAPEYYRQLKVSNETTGECLVYYKEGEANNSISVYLEGLLKIDDIFINQNKLIDSTIINGKTTWGDN